jgi:hypothetical protein
MTNANFVGALTDTHFTQVHHSQTLLIRRSIDPSSHLFLTRACYAHKQKDTLQRVFPLRLSL